MKKQAGELRVGERIETLGTSKRKVIGEIKEILPIHQKTKNQVGIRVLNEIDGFLTYFDKYTDTLIKVL